MSLEVIDRQIGELTPQWEWAREDCDLSRKLARLWEERFELTRDEDSLNGALYFYHHLIGIVAGSDPLIIKKLGELAEQGKTASLTTLLLGGKAGESRIQFW